MLSRDRFRLLGDKAYPIGLMLLPLFKGRPHVHRATFHAAHAAARALIERAFGLLKSRCGILRRMPLGPRRWHLVKHACCILHNICILENDEMPIEDDEDIDKDSPGGEDRDTELGMQKRDQIALTMAVYLFLCEYT